MRLLGIAYDLGAPGVAWLAAHGLRLGTLWPFARFHQLWPGMVVMALAHWGWYFFLHTQRGLWHYASLPDMVRIVKTALWGTLTGTTLLFLWNRLESVPRGVVLIYFLLLVGLMAGARFLYRYFLYRNSPRAGAVPKQRALIVGTGSAADQLIRQMMTNALSPYQAVAVISEEPGPVGRELHGLYIAGSIDDIAEAARAHKAEILLVALPHAHRRLLSHILSEARKAKLPCQTLPSINELLSNQVSLSDLRDITLEDLLGREPVRIDWSRISADLQEKTILVTGAGGSIGSGICRELARIRPRLLVLFDNGEHNLYLIDKELRNRSPALNFQAVLGDVRDMERVRWAMKTFSPQVIFHAAAYKHVPVVEMNPMEGVKVNVFGTKNVADCAVEANVEKFIFISTDKAVRPTNVMGLTKRIAEHYCGLLNGTSKTAFVTTRFGNVLGSSGSVVPLFREQLTRGGPLTVTHPNVERFFMTIPEACQLVLQAAVMGKGGELFVLDMGTPVKIRDLAEQMIRLSGLVPDRDVQIVYTGLRPGEKLTEELFYENEAVTKTDHERILKAVSPRHDGRRLSTVLTRMEQHCRLGNVQEVLKCLNELAEQYRRE